MDVNSDAALWFTTPKWYKPYRRTLIKLTTNFRKHPSNGLEKSRIDSLSRLVSAGLDAENSVVPIGVS